MGDQLITSMVENPTKQAVKARADFAAIMTLSLEQGSSKSHTTVLQTPKDHTYMYYLLSLIFFIIIINLLDYI
jgi:hypothetical protein